MKSFKEYLTESKKTYEFKVKIAGNIPKDFATNLKAPPLFDYKSLLFYSPMSRLWEFSFGAILSLVPQKKIANFPRFKKFANLELVALIFCLSIFRVHFILLLFIILLNFRELLADENILAKSNLRNVLIWLGNRSYTIYLVHLPFIWTARFSPFFENLRNKSDGSNLLLVLSCAVSILIGHLIHEKVENRFRKVPKISPIEKNIEFKLFKKICFEKKIKRILIFTQELNYR